MKLIEKNVRIWAVLAIGFIVFSCAEDDFLSPGNRVDGDGHISFSMGIVEMEDIDKTRGGEPHYNRAHHHEMTGAAVPMHVRFTQEKVIDKKFKASEQGVQDDTRGRRIDSIPDFYDSFGLISFRYNPLNPWATYGSSYTPYVHNEEVRRADDWRTAEYWPGSGRDLTFFAYAPYNAQGVTLSPSTQTGTPWLHHEVPEYAQNQSDLLISAYEHEVGTYNAIRHINFKHICAGVRFAIGSQMAPGTIKKIQLADVYGEGWYHFGASAWDSVKTEKTFTLNQNFSIAKGESNRLLTTGDNVFMMVPQTVPNDGRILVTIDDGTEHTLEAFIANDQWDIGTTTTYWLSTLVADGDTILNVARIYDPGSPSGIPATGGTATYEVRSYYTTAYGTRTAIPWTAYYTLDDDTTKHTVMDTEMLSAFTFAGGTSPVQSCSLTALAGFPRSVTQNTKELRKRTPKVNEDLAVGPGKHGSANCYVITAPGTYTFPLVYGNGLDNTGTPRAAADYLADNFVNHAGSVISGLADCPKIPEASIAAPTILWQDAYKLIDPSSLQIVTKNYNGTNYKCVQFTIDSVNICQGNVSLAIRNSSPQVMWSWHIWVTNHDINKTIRINNLGYGGTGPNTTDVAPVLLGYCDEDTVNYTPRRFHLSIIQSYTNDTARVDINQLEADFCKYGRNAPTWQWGRKDPFVPANGLTNNNKTTYVHTASWAAFLISGGNTDNSLVTIPTTILCPGIFYGRYNNDWFKSHNANLWNVDYDGFTSPNCRPVKKTVYDPCPPGFCMPNSGIFAGIGGGTTHSYQQTGNTNPFWVAAKGLSDFPTNSANSPAGNPAYISIPACGFREVLSGTFGKINGVSAFAATSTAPNINIWAGTQNPNNNLAGNIVLFYLGNSLWFTASLTEQCANAKAYGFSVLPAAQ